MKRTLRKAGVIGLVLTALLTSSIAWAQSDPTGMRRVTDTYAITNATIITAPGQKGLKTSVLIRNGVIEAIGANISIPKEAKTIAGDSLFIYPGFITGGSEAGITAPEAPERPSDFVSSNPPDEIAGITPWRSATDQFSISGSGVSDLRKAGFTVVQILPDGGMMAGKSAIIVLGNDNSTNILKENTALVASFTGARRMYPGTAAGVMAKFRDIYKNAELTKTHSDKYSTSPGVRRPEFNDTNMAMMDVISGETPVLFSASTDLEIRRAISLSQDLGFKLVLTDLEDYSNVIPLIKSSGSGVLVKLEAPDDKAIKAQEEEVSENISLQYTRVKEAFDMALKQAAELEAAGIPFAFTTKNVKANSIMKSLKLMIENGLSETAAMAALTTNPASLMGLTNVAGTLEKGKMANMVISTESIFGEDAQIKHVIVDGYIFDYETKAKKKASTNGDENNGSVPIDGVWEYETESPAGSGEGTITISKDGDGYTGEITYDDPSGSGKASTSIENIVLEGNSLSFSFSVNAQGMNIPIEVSGDITGNSLEGTMALGQFGSFPLTATLNPSQNSTK